MFPHYLNLNIRGVAVENGVPIKIMMARRVAICVVETVVPSFTAHMRDKGQNQVM